MELSEDEKWTHARKLNIARRHLNRDQKNKLLTDEIKADPGKSDRQIANDLDLSNSTVSSARKELEERGDVCESHTSTDTLGRNQPRRRNKYTFNSDSIHHVLTTKHTGDHLRTNPSMG